MDDRFLSEMQRDPDPQFATRLRDRLRAQEGTGAPGFRWRPALAAAAGLAVVTALFVFPSVRASAQAMLDMFRVRNFAAVQFDPARIEAIHQQIQGDPLMAFGKHEVLKDAPRQEFPTPEAASAAAGIPVEVPHDLPAGLTLRKVAVEGEMEGRFTPDAARLRALLQSLDIRDLEVPANIDGRSITVRKPPIVIQEYRSDRRHAVVLQARSPEVELPGGVDLAQLAEIGMRIIGVEPGQARKLARSVDWHTTLLVPVPATASSFRSVEVNGNRGLIVTTDRRSLRHGHGPRTSNGPKGNGPGTIVMWSEGDRVFGVAGDLSESAMMQVAESVR